MTDNSAKLKPEQIREKFTICAVDNSAAMCNDLKGLLIQMGFNSKNIFTIYGARAGNETSQMLDVYKSYEDELSWRIPKLHFLEWDMQGITGLELLKKIRGCDDPRISNMIVIIATSNAVKEKVVSAINAGVDHFIAKPLSPDILAKKFKEISSKLFMNVENMIHSFPHEINNIIEAFNKVIAMDIQNDRALKLKNAFLSNNKEEVAAIVGDKVANGKNSAVSGKYSRAIGDFDKALELNLSDPAALMEYGKMMMKKTSYEEAVNSFQSAIEFLRGSVEPQQQIREVDLLELLGEAQLKFSMTLEKPDEALESAIKTLERASKLYEDTKNREGKARSLGQIGNVYTARADNAEKEAARTKTAGEASNLMAKAMVHREKALSGYEEALRNDARQSLLLIKLADIYRKTGQEDKAINAMKRAEDIKTDTPESLIEFGKFHLNNGNRETAMSYFNSAKEIISVEDIELYEEILLCLLEHDLPDEAVPFIENIADERPDLYNNLGLAYRRVNRFKDAIETYEKAIQNDLTGDRVAYIFNQAITYKLAGNIPMSIKNLLQAYKTDSSFEKAKEHLQRNCSELCDKALQNLMSSDIASAARNFKLAYIADPSSQKARDGLLKLKVDYASIPSENELSQLGITSPSEIIEGIRSMRQGLSY